MGKTTTAAALTNFRHYYKNIVAVTKVHPTSNDLGAEFNQKKWQNINLRLITGAHSADDISQLILEASDPIIEEPKKWVIFFEGKSDTKNYSSQSLIREVRLVKYLEDKHGAKVVDFIPSGNQNDHLIKLVHDETCLPEDIIWAEDLFQTYLLGLSTARENGYPNPEVGAADYVEHMTASLETPGSARDMLLAQVRDINERGDFEAVAEQFALINEKRNRIRNDIAREKCQTYLTGATGIENMLAIVGYDHAEIFGQPNSSPKKGPRFTSEQVHKVIDALQKTRYW